MYIYILACILFFHYQLKKIKLPRENKEVEEEAEEIEREMSLEILMEEAIRYCYS